MKNNKVSRPFCLWSSVILSQQNRVISKEEIIMTTINTNTEIAQTTFLNAELVNLTPHTVNVLDSEGNEILAIKSTGLARVSVTTTIEGYLNGIIPLTHNVYGDVVGLPDPEEGKIYIVSVPVAKSLPERNDLFVPNDLVRDEDGVIVGCRSLNHV